MLTDTGPFRYPEYHGSRDLPDRINGPEFARAAHGIIQAIRRLAATPVGLLENDTASFT